MAGCGLLTLILQQQVRPEQLHHQCSCDSRSKTPLQVRPPPSAGHEREGRGGTCRRFSPRRADAVIILSPRVNLLLDPAQIEELRALLTLNLMTYVMDGTVRLLEARDHKGMGIRRRSRSDHAQPTLKP